MALRKVGTLLVWAGTVAAGCGGGGDDALRQVADLRAKADARAAEVESLRDRLESLEDRSRAVEEQVASLSIRPGVPGGRGAEKAASPGEASAPAEPASDGAKPAPVAVSTFLDTEEGKQRMREFLQAEEKEKEQRQAQAVQEQMETALRDRVTGYWTEQLGLDRRQQDAVIAIGTDAMKKMGDLWRGARDARSDPGFFATAREKTQQIVQDAKDQVAQALTAEQFSKFEEISASNPGGLLGGAFGGRGGFMGGAPPGGRPPRGDGQGGGAPPR